MMTRATLPVAPPARVAPLYRGFAETNGFCRLCGQGFALTPTYGNPARCPDCTAYMKTRDSAAWQGGEK